MDPKIGQDYSTRYFNGTISDVAVWSVAITDDEIALLAQSRMKRMPLQIQPSNLKAYLPLDDVSEGTTINTKDFIDMSGNGNNGTGSDAGGESIGEAETYISYPQTKDMKIIVKMTWSEGRTNGTWSYPMVSSYRNYTIARIYQRCSVT